MQLLNTFINAPAVYTTQHHLGNLSSLVIIWLGMYVDAFISYKMVQITPRTFVDSHYLLLQKPDYQYSAFSSYS